MRPVVRKPIPVVIGLTAFPLLVLVGWNSWRGGGFNLFQGVGGPSPWRRPYGMAPIASQAFVQACYDSQIHPARTGQTIGDAELSVGYHKRDGVLLVKGQRIDYCAAVDIGVHDLDQAGINRFLHNLTKQGFASWYRENGKWKGREHIHAVYTQLPMKRQLRGQVRLFLNERKSQGVRLLPWERRMLRTHYSITYPKK
jgi:hypothetical protein